jgi:hypothetical protein
VQSLVPSLSPSLALVLALVLALPPTLFFRPADLPSNHSFTWLNSRLEPVEVAAHEYMTLMQRWISGKIDDSNNFPTDPNGVSFAHEPSITTSPLPHLAGGEDWLGKRSGFPKQFLEVCKTIFRQMLRVYSHLYWAHFTDYYHLNLEKQLNSCFCHFVQTATTLDMLTKQELEPLPPMGEHAILTACANCRELDKIAGLNVEHAIR